MTPETSDDLERSVSAVDASRPKSNLLPGLENDESAHLPNRLLAAIPISDLGESLDSRHLGESLNGGLISAIGGADSVDSGDSGYDEYDEEYSHIITESSPAEAVAIVEAEFRPVDLPELLVITGRACARILSGYQKNKADEAKILTTLREEGLLAKPKGKTAGGMSFEVVDASIVDNNLIGRDKQEGEDAFITAKFIPTKTLRKLELRRGTLKKAPVQIETKLAEAEQRRKALEEEKIKTVLEHSGLDRHGRLRSATASAREQLYSATVAKRQQQLQEIRDRLKDKHKKNDMIRLKKQLQFGGTESGFKIEGIGIVGAVGGDNFFDD